MKSRVQDMVWRGKHSIISANQRDMPSHGVTCRVRGDFQGQRVVTGVCEGWPPSSPDSCVVGAGLCHLAAFTGVIFLDRKPLPGTFTNAVTPLCLCVAAWWICDQCGWAVQLYSAMTGCRGALGLILKLNHADTFSLCTQQPNLLTVPFDHLRV